MPKASLPKTAKGWVAALAASMVGFLSGLAVLHVLDRWMK